MLDSGRLQKLIQTINSVNETARREAIHALKEYQVSDWDTVAADMVHKLVEALRQQLPARSEGGVKPAIFRQEAVIVLGNIGPRAEEALPQLLVLLEPGVPDGIREAAAVALGKIGKKARPAVGPLVDILRSNCRISLADRATRALGEIGCADERVRSTLVNLWLTPVYSQSNQIQVAIALCKLRIEAPSLLKSLTGLLLSSRDASLRKSAAGALSWCKKTDTDVVPALVAALHDDDEEVRKLAEEGLAQLRVSQKAALLVCASQLKEAVCAEAALRKSGAQAVPALIEALAAKDTICREKAARTLGSIGEAAVDAVPALSRILNDKDPDVRLSAAKALWNVSKDERVVPVLAELLGRKEFPDDSNGEGRRRFLQSVIESLCRIGPSAKAAVAALNRKANDENRLIRESAQRALREIGAAVPVSKVAAK